jgi:hypothetical protein
MWRLTAIWTLTWLVMRADEQITTGTPPQGVALWRYRWISGVLMIIREPSCCLHGAREETAWLMNARAT